MANLRHGFALLLKRNPDGSYKTQADKSNHLVQISKQLKQDGYRQLNIHNLKLKHVQHLVDKWKSQGLANDTIKNRVASLRWVFEKVGKEHALPKTNAELGIKNRVYSDNSINKAKQLDTSKLDRINNPYLQVSLKLQSAFGLRREESIKFSPTYAIQNDKLVLKGSWTKGGKPREIPIRTEYQKQVLEQVKTVAGNGALIPRGSNYIQQLTKYTNACSRVGLSKNHGLRHQYAQDRYKELTGWDCPKSGGLFSKDMTVEQKALDVEVRLIISKELGHEREAITVTYLGR